ncbi:purine/pyrimidine permease [Listeria weihenstephanensis]|uniref:Purine/pyrimidine permease n=1 Tax=Listeria weihenstephanensis TaxID=1006155 RepID=A0A841Z6G9_9LIST|nr:purine/pyrimidine permease [Listeria weihenstephanensis]MBC1499936.1 purine/pyrimidine permease [Listeria weihenstephanensis]
MKMGIAALQWMIFMIAAAIVAPIAIADLYQLSAADTAGFMQRTIFVLGIAGLLQGLLGHRLPIHEGPAGLWWSVFTIYAGFIGVLYTSNIEALQALSGGLLVSGVFFIILAVSGFIGVLAKLFTPTVTFVYLMLLVLQLSGSFIKGMFGISADSPTMDPWMALLSFIVVAATFAFGRSKILWLRQYSVIFSLLLGWGLFLIAGKAPTVSEAHAWFDLPKMFAFGVPTFDSGVITTAIFITLLLITNLVASVRLMEGIVDGDKPSDPKRYKRGGFISGINQLLGGGFSAIGSVPISGAAGFVAQTGQKSLKPFLIGCLLVSGITLFPPIMNVMSALPAPVGYAVTFVLFSNMVVMALKTLKNVTTGEDNAYLVIGISLMLGVGVMFLSPAATKGLPAAVIAVLNNGLIIGSVFAIILEQFFLFREKGAKSKKVR